MRLFIDNLREKRQTKAHQEQTAYAISLYFELQRKPDNETPSARFDTEITSSFISEPQQAHNMLPLPSSMPPKTTSFPVPAQGLRWRLWEEGYAVKSDSPEGDTAIPIPQTIVQEQQDAISTLSKELNDLRGIGGDKLRLFW